MSEREFWLRLEYRICRELDDLPAMAARRFWCDGFIPRTYCLDAPEPSIEGDVWMAPGQEAQQRWEFRLRLGRRFSSIDAIDWASLLPPDGATGWLDVDPDRRRLRMHLDSAGAGRPD